MTKEQKLAQIDALLKEVGLTRDEVIASWYEVDLFYLINSTGKTDVSKIKAGMFWYEDNTFSFKRLPDKRIKAIVELVEDGVIYGDLTASELFYIEEKSLLYEEVKIYLDYFSYLCKEGEKIAWYNSRQFEEVSKQYSSVRKSFERINKLYRITDCWVSDTFVYGSYINPLIGKQKNAYDRWYRATIRPVLALTVK